MIKNKIRNLNLSATLKINEHFSLTNDTKAISDVYKGKGPVSSLFMLGYAGWTPGQLEKERGHKPANLKHDLNQARNKPKIVT